MIGYYNRSVILTYIGLMVAILGISMALNGYPQSALLCLMGCGLCDCFDGAIARKCQRSESAKRFGVEIDSLCDLICFGVFPVILCWSVGAQSIPETLLQAFYVLASVIRLGYFNVQEIERAAAGGGHRTHYMGLPVTSIALIAPVLLLVDTLLITRDAMCYRIGMLVVGVLFIMPIQIKKPYGKTLYWLAGFGLVLFILVCLFGTPLNLLYLSD